MQCLKFYGILAWSRICLILRIGYKYYTTISSESPTFIHSNYNKERIPKDPNSFIYILTNIRGRTRPDHIFPMKTLLSYNNRIHKGINWFGGKEGNLLLILGEFASLGLESENCFIDVCYLGLLHEQITHRWLLWSDFSLSTESTSIESNQS